jgi:Spy/CpxP family protein refolding chaperone
MTKLKGLALIAAAAFAVTSAYAGDKDHACCAAGATHAKNDKDCSQTYATLNLTAEQKAKMDTFHADCKKGGCTKESMDKFMKSAEGILSKEQFATLKAECAKMHDKDAKA